MSNRRLLSGANRRERQGTASSSRTQHTQAPELPEYESPSFPLNKDARKALTDLSTNRDNQKYAEHIQKSLKLLSDSVRDINDKYTERKTYVKERQEKRGEGVPKSDRDKAEEKAALALKEEVPQLTDECESAVRHVIDLKIELEDSKSAWRETLRRTEAESVNAPEPRTNNEDDDASEASRPPVTGSLKMLREQKKKLANDYATKTMYERYALDNDYVGFKKMAHDAIYGGEDKPLPDPSRWFTQNGSRVDEEENEDLVIAEETISIYCPLSLAVMEDPYTSRKCKHTFDKKSIVSFFGRGGKKPCPQTGCEKVCEDVWSQVRV